ncbi:hypothetical protein BDZ91DRAFT_738615 [Kalaharituber pfeilii]|nr:hypothetical protein BDZ91DRAFT_738615 [Kalaharituber pfeilii]
MQMVQSLHNSFLWNVIHDIEFIHSELQGEAAEILTGAEMAERQRERTRAESVEHNETQDCITVSSTASV